MPILRIIAVALPQLLLLLPLAASMNLLGGWSQSDSGFNTLLLLFLMAPVVTMALLVSEIIRYRKARQLMPEKTSKFWLGIAVFVCAETLAINMTLLTQVRM